MKITFILLTFFCLHGYSNIYSQEKVSLQEHNSSLTEVIRKIKSQTGFVFFYQDEWLKGSKPVTIEVINENINVVLNRILQDQLLTYKIVGKMVVLKPFSLPEPTDKEHLLFFPIKGIIRGSDGRPLAGINVTIKQTSQGTVTDTAGAFSLNASIGNILVISGVGYERKEVKIENDADLVVSLVIKTMVLDTSTVIVSTGYQVIAKERATGSFTQIDNKKFNEVVGTNILSRLPYMASGVSTVPSTVNANDGYNGITIRGLSTLTKSIAKPLIILDNFEYNGNLNNLNPNDVDNITILKDAAAASIWGARAGNGVIVITTKSGKFNQRTLLSFNSNISITPKPDLFKIKTITSSDFIDLEMLLFNNKYRFRDTSYPSAYSFTPVYEILFKQRSGKISNADAQSQINALRSNDVRNDYEKYLYRNNVNQQYSLSLSGGTGNLAWNLSGGIDKNTNQDFSRFSRYNVQLGSSLKISKRINLKSNIYYTETSSDLSGSPSYGSIKVGSGANIPPYTSLAEPDGTAKVIYQDQRQGFIDTLGGGKLLDWRYYPLTDYENIHNRQQIQYINASLQLSYQILKELDFSIAYRMEKQNIEQTTLYDLSSFYTRNLINTFTSTNTGSIEYRIPVGGIFDINGGKLNDQQVRAQLNFTKNWRQSSLSAIGGSSIDEKKENSNLYRTYGYNEDNLSFYSVNYTTKYPSYFNNGNSGFIPNPASFSKTNIRFLTFYSNATYVLLGKYSLSASARTDASNTFGLKTNDKFKPHYSFGTAWNISKESFYNLSILDDLRLRVTYGRQGNVDPSKTALTTIQYSDQTNQYTQHPIANVSNYANSTLRWEQVSMTNIGLDFSLSGKRVFGSIEYFHKNITDMYSGKLIDPTIGRGTAASTNIGGFSGSGFDVSINSLNINKGIKWNTDIIINYSKDKLNKLYIPAPENGSLIGGQFTLVEGYSAYSYFALPFAGLSSENGNPLGYLNGKPSSNYDSLINKIPFKDLKYIGRLIPVISGSIGNNISWKRLNLSTRIMYKFLYYFRRESINYSNLVSSYLGHSDYGKRWQKPGDERITNVPSFIYPTNSLRDQFYTFSETLATKGDHIRLQYVNLSYQIENRSGPKSPFKNMEIYFSINNLGILWRANKENIDPDVPGGVSLPKTYSLGVRGTF